MTGGRGWRGGSGEELVAVTGHRDSRPILTRTAPVTAILVDGGFYLRRAERLFGHKTPKQRAQELLTYCNRHIKKENSQLYRIFYYDCPPSEKVLFHPLTKETVNLAKTEKYQWMVDFHQELVQQRKVALRRGEILETQLGYQLKPKTLKRLLGGSRTIADLTKEDFTLDITQKGVDMKLGLDIATLAMNGRVDQIVMIAGDSDFVPAAKHARRAGIDFLLDPMWARISGSLHEHIDGLWQCVQRKPANLDDPLHVRNLEEHQFAAAEDEDGD